MILWIKTIKERLTVLWWRYWRCKHEWFTYKDVPQEGEWKACWRCGRRTFVSISQVAQ